MDRLSPHSLKPRGADFAARAPLADESNGATPAADESQALDPGALAAKDKGPLLLLDTDAPDGAARSDTRKDEARPDDLAALLSAMRHLPAQASHDDRGPTDAGNASASAAGFLLLVEMFDGVLETSRRAFSGWRRKMLRKARSRPPAAQPAKDGDETPRDLET